MRVTCSACGSETDAASGFCNVCGTAVEKSGTVARPERAAPPLARRWLIRGVLALVLATGLWMFYRYAFRDYHPVIAAQPVVSVPSAPAGKIESTLIEARQEGPFIIVPVSEVARRRIVRFFDPSGRQTVPILAYVTPAGRLVTAMSLSENCQSQDFYLEGENIHCAHCPSYWNASSLEAYACCQKYFPDPIPSTVLGDELRIDADVVRRWQPRS
jgi:hypothetical protein